MIKRQLIIINLCVILLGSAWTQIQFKNSTGAAVLMHLTPNGELGIGTTAPGSYKLNVVGNTYISGTAAMNGFQLGAGTTANYVLTANSSGVGAWQEAAVKTDASLTGVGTTGSPLSLGWNDMSSSSGLIAVKSPGTGQTRAGYLANFSYTNEFGDEILSFNNSAGAANLLISGLSQARLSLHGQDGAHITMFEPNTPEAVIISATEAGPSGYTSSSARIYTNAGLVTQGTANRFIGDLYIGLGVGGFNAPGRLGIRTSSIPTNYESRTKGHALIDSGLVVGTPNMGSLSFTTDAGWINAQAVYDDGTQISDYVFDHYFDGKIRPEDMEKHSQYRLLPLPQMISFIEKERHLPTIIGREEWNKKEKTSLGELTNMLWETVETQAIYIKELKEDLDLQKTKMEKLEKALQQLQTSQTSMR